jgi:hypothetical protein
MRGTYVLMISDPPIPDAPVLLYCALGPYTLIDALPRYCLSDLANFDAKLCGSQLAIPLHSFTIFQIPNSDARVNSLLHVTASLSRRSVGYREIAISIATIPLHAENPEMSNPELFRILGHASFRLTALIASGNRRSRFRYARVSRLRKPRYPELRFSRIVRHVSLLFGWL